MINAVLQARKQDIKRLILSFNANINAKSDSLVLTFFTVRLSKRRVSYMQEHVGEEGCLFGFYLYCYSKISSATNCAHRARRLLPAPAGLVP